MLMERTKLILTLTTQIFLGYFKLFASAAFHQISVWAQSKAQYNITIKILSNGREGR
jgi:hypothetical protein